MLRVANDENLLPLNFAFQLNLDFILSLKSNLLHTAYDLCALSHKHKYNQKLPFKIRYSHKFIILVGKFTVHTKMHRFSIKVRKIRKNLPNKLKSNTSVDKCLKRNLKFLGGFYIYMLICNAMMQTECN